MSEAATGAAQVIGGVVWDLTSYFPSFDGPEMLEFKAQLRKDVAALVADGNAAGPMTEATLAVWEGLILRAENLMARFGHVGSYVENLASADASNEKYSIEDAALTKLGADASEYDVAFQQALKVVSDDVFAKLLARPGLAGAEHYLLRTRERAQKTMSQEKEVLANDLSVDGVSAWGRLYDKISGKLEFDMAYPDGRTERLPISQWRSLMSDGDRAVGKAAFEGGNRAWEGVADVCAAALNAISGTRLTLNKHRGIDDFLYPALFQAQIKRETLDAMYAAIYDNIEIAREIFRAKAKAMGRTGIWFFEREAPLPMEVNMRYTWQQGSDMVLDAFSRSYPGLGEYYKSFLAKRWMESEPRPNKRPGAYCTGSAVTSEERVYMTFNGALGDVTTVAHEIGHAWHGHLMNDIRVLAQGYPMTLAETASIFGEHILAEGFYSDPAISDAQKLMMLDEDLCGAAVLLLDITVRFEFEKQYYTERKDGEISVSRFKELMVEAQRRVFGDALLEDGVDPLFWASKLHFYIPGAYFYNYPYTFGFLFARTMYTLFKQNGPSFLPKYEAFLRLSGSAPVEEVARQSIGADTTQPAFWAGAIKSMEEPLKQYKALLAKR